MGRNENRRVCRDFLRDFFDVIIMRKNAESVKRNVGWGLTRVPGLIEAGGAGRWRHALIIGRAAQWWPPFIKNQCQSSHGLLLEEYLITHHLKIIPNCSYNSYLFSYEYLSTIRNMFVCLLLSFVQPGYEL